MAYHSTQIMQMIPAPGALQVCLLQASEDRRQIFIDLLHRVAAGVGAALQIVDNPNDASLVLVAQVKRYYWSWSRSETISTDALKDAEQASHRPYSAAAYLVLWTYEGSSEDLVEFRTNLCREQLYQFFLERNTRRIKDGTSAESALRGLMRKQLMLSRAASGHQGPLPPFGVPHIAQPSGPSSAELRCVVDRMRPLADQVPSMMAQLQQFQQAFTELCSALERHQLPPGHHLPQQQYPHPNHPHHHGAHVPPPPGPHFAGPHMVHGPGGPPPAMPHHVAMPAMMPPPAGHGPPFVGSRPGGSPLCHGAAGGVLGPSHSPPHMPCGQAGPCNTETTAPGTCSRSSSGDSSSSSDEARAAEYKEPTPAPKLKPLPKLKVHLFLDPPVDIASVEEQRARNKTMAAARSILERAVKGKADIIICADSTNVSVVLHVSELRNKTKRVPAKQIKEALLAKLRPGAVGGAFMLWALASGGGRLTPEDERALLSDVSYGEKSPVSAVLQANVNSDTYAYVEDVKCLDTIRTMLLSKADVGSQ